jgi:hypothetical protein
MLIKLLRLAKTMPDREKIGALMLAESLRRNHPLFKPSLNAESSQLNTVFELYEVWWQSPLPPQEKLEINPLQNTTCNATCRDRAGDFAG